MENHISVNKREYNKLKRNYGTAKIITIVLIIGLLLIGGYAVYEEQKYNSYMFKCSKIAKELKECKTIPVNESYLETLIEDING